jgi:hypothetical protein
MGTASEVRCGWVRGGYQGRAQAAAHRRGRPWSLALFSHVSWGRKDWRKEAIRWASGDTRRTLRAEVGKEAIPRGDTIIFLYVIAYSTPIVRLLMYSKVRTSYGLRLKYMHAPTWDTWNTLPPRIDTTMDYSLLPLCPVVTSCSHYSKVFLHAVSNILL